MPSSWLLPLVLLCSINPEGDGSAPGLHAAELDAARWGGGALITGRRPTSGNDGPLYLALTFDDGPDVEVTPKIVATLERHEVPATFFAVGWRFEGRTARARAQAAVLRDLIARGYAVGNHTVHHDDLRTMSAWEARAEIDVNERMLARETGRRPYLFRPPYGGTTPAAAAHLARRGYTEVRWNIDSQDWLARRADDLPERVLADALARGGGVVLLHDTKPWTARALPRLLAAIEAENCRRRTARERLLVPVTLDYFMRDADGAPREVPRAARAAEKRYVARLDTVCSNN